MVKPKKHLGQHFLLNKAIAQQIVDNLSVNEHEIIIEIGAGTGILTQYLVEKNNQIIAVDIDTESIAFLQEKYATQNNLSIQEVDFLKMNLAEITNNSLHIIGNFPYNISSQILFKILENRILVDSMVGMFQKEVADRVVAKHSNKTYGILSVLVQAYYEVYYVLTVDENEFFPPPKVKSAVIKLIKKQTTIGNDALFFTLVKTAFNQRRKKLSNALKSLEIPNELKSHSCMELRAEQLSVDDFIEFTKDWENYKKQN